MSWEEEVEIMISSIHKNVGELSELCVQYGISNAYELMDAIVSYAELVKYIKEQNNSGNLRGLHDNILDDLGFENENI